MMSVFHKPRLGIALSGGGARGLVHIGVLKALENAGIPIDYLSGTSMGGVIAAGYAAGMSPEDLEQVAREMGKTRNLIRLADPVLPSRGVFRGNNLEAFFDKHMQGKTFADLKIPLTLVAVDLNSSQEIHLCQGLVAEALRATVSVPGLLNPVETDGQRLVDGGLLNNIPVDVVRQMGADVILAVDTRGSGKKESFSEAITGMHVFPKSMVGMLATLGDSLDLMLNQLADYKLKEAQPDFIIRPEIPNEVTVVTGFNRALELITSGEQASQSIMPDLQASLKTRLAFKNLLGRHSHPHMSESKK